MTNAVKNASAAAVVVMFGLMATRASANSGVQLPLSQYQAGTEQTNSSLIVNPNFESVDANNFPIGWTAATPDAGTIMTAGSPNPANLPSPATVLGTRVQRVFDAGGIDAFDNYKITQNITLAPNTDYVLSSYLWNYGQVGPAPHTDLVNGDLVGVELEPTVPGDETAGYFVEPIGADGGTSANGGFFVYKSFNSSQFLNSNGVVRLELEFDPNQNIQPFTLRPPLSAQWDNIALTPLAQFSSQVFTNPAGGSYDTVANWINGPVNARTAIATFRGSTSQATVSLSANRRMAVINFDGAGGYVLNGAGSIVLDHEEKRDAVIINSLQGNNSIQNTIVVNAGTDAFSTSLTPRNFKVNVANSNGVLTVGDVVAGSVGTFGTGTFSVIKTGPGRFDPAGIRARSLQIDQGTVRMVPGSQTSRVQTLVIAGDSTPTARLDLTNRALVVDYSDASPLPTILAQLTAGAGGGNGIGSGFSVSYGVGYAEASQLSMVPAGFGSVDSTAVLLRGTLLGDANLDGTVNLDDFTALAASFGGPGGWINGDFNYASGVNLDDFTALAANFGQSVAGDAPRGAVPEPTSAVLLVAAAALMHRRRHMA